MTARILMRATVTTAIAFVASTLLPGDGRAQNPLSLSEQDEIALGRHAAGEIEKDIVLVDDAAVNNYVTRLGDLLVQQSGRKNIDYSFKVVNSPEVNAFALPGGYIYINRGLIEAAETPDELAGVLGHEIGHVVARHGAEQAARAGLVQAGIGVLGGLLGRGTASTVGQTAADLVATGVFMKFSRDAERTADLLGAQMVHGAQLHPKGMVSFFNKLADLQQNQPNVVQRFFSSHPSPSERSQNLTPVINKLAATSEPSTDVKAFREMKRRLATLPRPEVTAAKAAAERAAAAVTPTEPEPQVRARNLLRDREIAQRFAPTFYQALGPAPRFDYVTNFDFDGDWRGDNNWANAADARFPLKAQIYYAVFETRTHYFIHYAAFHPRDYKGGEERGALVSELMRLGVQLGGQYDPTGRAREVVMAHENDLEGALVVAEKQGPALDHARLLLVETLAHNNYFKYAPAGSSVAGEPLQLTGVRPQLFIEPQGHGIEAWQDSAHQRKLAQQGFLIYTFTGSAEDPEKTDKNTVGYDLLPVYETFWPRAKNGKSETFGEEHDYGIVTVRMANGAEDVERHLKLGVVGSALNGVVGAANMSRPPWGWFDGQDRGRLLGEWFLQPAETIRRRWNLPESFSTTYTYHPFFGQFR